MSDVVDWLRALGLEMYAKAFESQHIDLELLRELCDGDLKELGVASLGHPCAIPTAHGYRAGTTGRIDASFGDALVGCPVMVVVGAVTILREGKQELSDWQRGATRKPLSSTPPSH